MRLMHPSVVVVEVQPKGWMDKALMHQYIKEIWSQHTKHRHSLLVLLDNFKAHYTGSVFNAFEKVNSKSAIIPGSCTTCSKLQFLDVCINWLFKDFL